MRFPFSKSVYHLNERQAPPKTKRNLPSQQNSFTHQGQPQSLDKHGTNANFGYPDALLNGHSTFKSRKQGMDQTRPAVNVSFEPDGLYFEAPPDQSTPIMEGGKTQQRLPRVKQASNPHLLTPDTQHKPRDQLMSLYSLSESAFSSVDSDDLKSSDDEDFAHQGIQMARVGAHKDDNSNAIQEDVDGNRSRLTVLIDNHQNSKTEATTSEKDTPAIHSIGHYVSAMNLLKRMASFSNTDFNRGSSNHLWSLGLESTLVYSHVRTMKTKDFSKEIRGKMDVEDYLMNGETFIDHPGTNIYDILDSVLDRVRLKEPTINVQQTLDQLLNVPLDILAATMQGTRVPPRSSSVGLTVIDQSWIVIMHALDEINKRHITIIKLKHLVNLGSDRQEIRFVVVIFTPSKEKGTKSFVEIGKSLATLFTDGTFRQKLLLCHDESSFKKTISDRMQILIKTPRKRSAVEKKISVTQEAIIANEEESISSRTQRCFLFRGIRDDIVRKVPFYFSDFMDGINGRKTKPKVFSATFFLYFACILPAIAIGAVNEDNTEGKIGVRKCVLAQAIAGLAFSLLSGQPLVVLLSTAPIAIYTKIMKQFAVDYEMPFLPFYSATGICTWFFMTLYSVTNLPIIMRYCYRSVEEAFALFVALAYVVDAVKSTYKIFDKQYCESYVTFHPNGTADNSSCAYMQGDSYVCHAKDYCSKASCMLLILLMLATFWLAFSLFNFNRSPYLDAAKREILSGYALPFAVLAATFLTKYIVNDIDTKKFKFVEGVDDFKLSPIQELPWWGWGLAFAIGFFLSVLLFIEQNVAESIVCSSGNKIEKGPSFYWDLFLLAQINLFLSLFGFPVVHGALPHSPMHVQALSDTEQRNNQGVMQDVIVHVRETRVAAFVSHALILLSFFYLLPSPMDSINIPVLNGVFLFIAAISLRGNELFDRLLLLFTEQTAYPPHHYVRHVPQRKIHAFTFIQILQLLILCALGFSPVVYLKMVFPLVVILFMPIRERLFPLLMEQQYLDALDGH